ncbi:MAG: nitroreductase family protein [Acidithiobacillus sp.]
MSRVPSIRAYHEASKHQLHRYASGPDGLDWASQPDPFRHFDGAPRQFLPLLADTLATPFSALQHPQGVTPRPLDGEHIAILLEISLALSAWKVAGAARWPLRCNPSSGNLHPSEGYLLCPELPGLGAGLWHYVSVEHALEHRFAPRDIPAWQAAWPAPAILIGLSSVVWREAWKYGERAFRYAQHDLGHALAALRYAAASLGWQARLLDQVADETVAELLGLDREEDFPVAEERESPDLLLLVGAAPQEPDLSLLQGRDGRWQGTARRLSTSHRSWAAITEAQEAGTKPATAPLPPWLPASLPALSTTPDAGRAGDLFRQRRSAVAFDGRTTIAASTFFTLLDALLPRPEVAPWDAWPQPPAVHPYLFVHRVQGIPPGLYALPRSPEGATALRAALRPDWLWETVPGTPAHLPLYLLLPAPGESGAELNAFARLVSCHQAIAADSAFSLGMLADCSALEDEPWSYRQRFWEAGMLGQVLYLQAEAHGLRGTGIGCFFDDEAHRLLGLAPAGPWQDLYHFTVGTPVEDLRITSEPPYARRSTASP